MPDISGVSLTLDRQVQAPGTQSQPQLPPQSQQQQAPTREGYLPEDLLEEVEFSGPSQRRSEVLARLEANMAQEGEQPIAGAEILRNILATSQRESERLVGLMDFVAAQFKSRFEHDPMRLVGLLS